MALIRTGGGAAGAKCYRGNVTIPASPKTVSISKSTHGLNEISGFGYAGSPSGYSPVGVAIATVENGTVEYVYRVNIGGYGVCNATVSGDTLTLTIPSSEAFGPVPLSIAIYGA